MIMVPALCLKHMIISILKCFVSILIFICTLGLEPLVSQFGTHLFPVLLHTPVCGPVGHALQLKSLIVFILKTSQLNVV